MDILSLIEKYIDNERNSWTASTLRSERFRLRGVSKDLSGDPQRLWDSLGSRKPYSRVTCWVRVTDFWNYLINEGDVDGPNPYQVFKQKNERLFKNAYRRKQPDTTLSEARGILSAIPDEASRQLAAKLLGTGMRFDESLSLKDGEVLGKGEKYRRVAVEPGEVSTYDKSYRSFHRHLAKVGLKPHDLRKILAQHLHDNGFGTVELCEVFGWNSYATARSYIKATESKKLMSKVRSTVGED